MSGSTPKGYSGPPSIEGFSARTRRPYPVRVMPAPKWATNNPLRLRHPSRRTSQMLQWNTKVTAILQSGGAARSADLANFCARQLHLVTSRPKWEAGRILPRGCSRSSRRSLSSASPRTLAATVAFARDPGSATTIAGVGAFLVASTLAERFPVPVEGADANGVSLGFVFALAALVLFGWAPATFVYATAPTLVAHRPAKPAHPHDLQRRRVRARRRPGRLGADAVPRHIAEGVLRPGCGRRR